MSKPRFCAHGHEMTPENTVMRATRGRPFAKCRTCKRRETQAYNRRHWDRQRAKRHAWHVINNGIRRGWLKPDPCSVCGTEDVRAHHPNGYEGEAVLDIVWLCPPHHAEAHRESGVAA